MHDIVYFFTFFKKRGGTCTLVTTPFLFFSSFLVIFTIHLAYHKVQWYNFININNLLECFQKGMLTMDEKDYELLLELNESKNITKTAAKTVYDTVRHHQTDSKMEEELQCTLFLRSKKGILFTPAGEQILPYASEILANSRKLKEQVSACQNQVCGTTPPRFFFKLLPLPGSPELSRLTPTSIRSWTYRSRPDRASISSSY